MPRNRQKVEEPAWIADTGRYHIAVKDGVQAAPNSEIEPIEGTVLVQISSIGDVVRSGAVVKTMPTNGRTSHMLAVSANGDRTIGDKIAEAMEKVGKEGVIKIGRA